MVLVGCNISERAGDAAGTGSHASGNAEVASLDLSVDIGSYGSLHVGGGPLIAGEEGNLTLTFTANSDLNKWEEDGGNGNNTERYPALSLSFDSSVSSSCDEPCHQDLNFIKSVSSSGKYITLNPMGVGNSMTFNLKVTAQSNFTLTPSVMGENIDETGSGVEITVHSSDDEEADEQPPKPKGTWQHRLTRAERTYNLTPGGAVKSVNPWQGYDQVDVHKGHRPYGDVLIDYDDFYYYNQSKNGKLRLTLFKSSTSTKQLKKDDYLDVCFSNKLEIMSLKIVSNTAGINRLTTKDGDNCRGFQASKSLGLFNNLVIEFELKPNQDSADYPVTVSVLPKGGQKEGGMAKVVKKKLPGGRKPYEATAKIENGNKKFFDVTLKSVAGYVENDGNRITIVHIYFKASRDTTDIIFRNNDLNIFFDTETKFEFESSKFKSIRGRYRYNWDKFLKDIEVKKEMNSPKPFFSGRVKGDMKKGDIFMLVFKLTLLKKDGEHTISINYDPVGDDMIGGEADLRFPKHTPFSPDSD